MGKFRRWVGLEDKRDELLPESEEFHSSSQPKSSQSKPFEYERQSRHDNPDGRRERESCENTLQESRAGGHQPSETSSRKPRGKGRQNDSDSGGNDSARKAMDDYTHEDPSESSLHYRQNLKAIQEDNLRATARKPVTVRSGSAELAFNLGPDISSIQSTSGSESDSSLDSGQCHPGVERPSQPTLQDKIRDFQNRFRQTQLPELRKTYADEDLSLIVMDRVLQGMSAIINDELPSDSIPRGQIHDKHNPTIAVLEQRVAAQKKELEQARAERDHYYNSHSQQASQISAMKRQITSSTETQENIKKYWQSLLRDKDVEKRNMEEIHTEALRDLGTQHALEVQGLKNEHSTRIQGAQNAHAAEIKRVRQAHHKEVTGLNSTMGEMAAIAVQEKTEAETAHQDQLDEANRGFNNRLRIETQKYYDDVNQLDKQLRDTKEQHDEMVTRLKASHRLDKEQLIDQHTEEMTRTQEAYEASEEKLTTDFKAEQQRLVKQVQQLNAALLTRDDEMYHGAIFNSSGLPRKPDEKLRDQFLELHHMVEDLARSTWKQKQPMWKDKILQSINHQHNQRELKKFILQDMLWSLLFRSVFDSPFRLFGEEGLVLDKQWVEQSGEASSVADAMYTWPAPEIQTERWRYMTIKECREVLTKAVPSEWDPRARLKKDYKDGQLRLVKELKTALSEMVDLDTASTQLIEKLVRKAGAMWLEFAMHRCRIVLKLTGSILKSTADKINEMQEGSLLLTLRPALGRYGNVEGVKLQIFTVIDGCAGVSLKIS